MLVRVGSQVQEVLRRSVGLLRLRHGVLNCTRAAGEHLAVVRHSALMEGLDLIDNNNWRVWTVGPSSLSFLPRATMLAEIWANE